MRAPVAEKESLNNDITFMCDVLCDIMSCVLQASGYYIVTFGHKYFTFSAGF